MLLFVVVSAQTVSVTFTGRDASNQYIPLNRVVVSNLTRGWQETLFWPDTVLVMMDQTGIEDVETFPETSLRLSQNNPNPFDGTTYVNLNVTETGEVSLVMTDITGRIVSANNYSPLPQSKTEPKANTDNLFVAGDQMEYVGFIALNGTEEESGHAIQTQDSTQTIILSFAFSIYDSLPCPGTPTITDIDGNVYSTVQLGQQCWMRENLRATHYADSIAISIGNANISYSQPYYYNYVSHALSLEKRGYLYNWPAVMHGAASSETNPSWVQGICPTGWHVPSHAEWIQLTEYVSSRSVFSCDGNSNHIAKSLASAEGWNSDYDYHQCTVGNNQGANNATGFCAFPAGQCNGETTYFNGGSVTRFWSSTATTSGNKWMCSLGYNSTYVWQNPEPPYCGFSVRCLRD